MIILPSYGAIPATCKRSFSPTQLPGLAAWFDGGDATTHTLSGATLTGWSDKSGNGRNATRLGSTTPTVTSNSLNGRSTVRTGSASGFTYSLTSVPTSFVALVRLNTTVSPGGDSSFDFLGGAPPTGSYGYYIGKFTTASSGDFYVTYPNPGGTTGFDAYSGTITVGSWVLIGGVYSSGATTAYNNGIAGTPVSGTFPSGSIAFSTIGYSRFGSSNVDFADADFAEILMGTSAWSTSDRQKAEGYICNRWAKTDLLAVGHPYKNSAP